MRLFGQYFTVQYRNPPYLKLLNLLSPPLKRLLCPFSSFLIRVADLAAAMGDLCSVETLFAAGAALEDYSDRNITGRSPLHYASKEGYLPVLKFLLSKGAKVNLQSKCDGKTPLHYAVRDESPACVQALLEAGAEVDALDNHERTPLLCALTPARQPRGVLHLLLRAGASTEQAKQEGLMLSMLTIPLERIP